MSIILRVFEKQQNFNWTKILPQVVRSYNGKYHKVLKATPNYAHMKKHEQEIWDRLYSNYFNKKQKQPKFSANQNVRVSLNKGIFSKGYLRRYSEEIFSIAKVLPTQPPTYLLKDKDGEEIKGEDKALK